MRFEWDEAKDRRNRVKHKISFETAKAVFDDPNLLSLFDRVVEGDHLCAKGNTSGTELV
jgi:uncharacterized DUF497 family protein